MNLLYYISFSISSIYIFPSGNPQPADFLMLFCSICIFFKLLVVGGRVQFHPMSPASLLIVFVINVFLISSYWSLKMSDFVFFRDFLFYSFNVFIFVALLIHLNSRENTRRWILYSLYTAAVVSGLGVLISLGVSSRPTGFFNNPNQLAFYSLLVWCCVLVLTEAKLNNGFFYWLAFTGSLLGVFAAASLGAMAGFLILVGVMLLRNISGRYVLRMLISSALLVAFALTVFQEVTLSVVSNVETRLLRAESKLDDMYEERNYERILVFPEYLILGAGEARLDRFYPHDVNEIHSTPGNLFFSYGLLGLLSVSGAWFIALYRSPGYVWFIAAAPMVYSLSHMGLRTTMFWVLLALIWHVHGRSVFTERACQPK